MRITAASAGVGAAVGTVLFLVLRLVAGQRVLDGLSATLGGSSPFADFLPADGPSSASYLLLPVALGSGLVAGLLIGFVLRAVSARRGFARPAFVMAGSTLCGMLVALELHAYGNRLDTVSSFGWFAYAPPSASFGRQGVLYSSVPSGPGPWGPLLVTGAVVGLVVGAMAGVAALWIVRARRA